MRKIIMCLASVLFSMTMHAQFSGSGAGTENYPYLITDANQLFEVRNNLNAYYKVMNDIDLGEWIKEDSPAQGWNPIGNEATPFAGVFDGNNKIIKGLFINKPTVDGVGLFGAVKNAFIVNVCLLNPKVKGQNHVGGIAGKMLLDRYSLSYIAGNVLSGGSIEGGSYVGGVVGSALYDKTYLYQASDIIVINGIEGNGCYSNVVGNSYVGGICGAASGAKGEYRNYAPKEYSICVNVSDNRQEGHIKGQNSVGGILGAIVATTGDRTYQSESWLNPYSIGLHSYVEVKRNVSSGVINGSQLVGGIVGKCISPTESYGKSSIVTNNVCAADTLSTASGDVFRITNYNWSNNYGNSNTIMLINGKEVTPNDNGYNGASYGMKTLSRQSTYSGMGFDFEKLWSIVEGKTLPYSACQSKPASVTSFIAGSKSTMTGTAEGNGTVYICALNKDNTEAIPLTEAPVVDGAWELQLGNVTKGTIAQVFFSSADLMTSIPVYATAEASTSSSQQGKPGDANGDGVVDSADVTAIINYILGKPSSSFNKENADVTGDGEILIDDAVQTVQMIMDAQ